MIVTRDSVWPQNAARDVKFYSGWIAWVPEFWDADHISANRATMVVFRRGAAVTSVDKIFSATGASH